MKKLLIVFVFMSLCCALLADNKVVFDTTKALRQYEIPADQQSGMALQVRVRNDPWRVQVQTNAKPMPSDTILSSTSGSKSRSSGKKAKRRKSKSGKRKPSFRIQIGK